MSLYERIIHQRWTAILAVRVDKNQALNYNESHMSPLDQASRRGSDLAL